MKSPESWGRRVCRSRLPAALKRSGTARVGLGIRTLFAAPLIPFLWADAAWAAGNIPGGDQAGILYAIAHLHPAVYLVLFLIFFLSMTNLILRSMSSGGNWFGVRPWGHRGGLVQESQDDNPASAVKQWNRNGARRCRSLGSGLYDGDADSIDDAILGPVRRVRKAGKTLSSSPTPLDGINHPLPSFSRSDPNGSPVSKIVDKDPKTGSSSNRFKFSSAVNLPSPEELARRGKEKLAVSGTVKGPDEKGIPSVIVYLADEKGNRMGQSCRSTPNTGEFRVQVNQPGRYILHGYKRGFVVENTGPSVLPIESGKIEGFNLKMIPDGCLVHGRVIRDQAEQTIGDLEVSCVVDGGGLIRSARTRSSGEFTIYGIPVASRAVLEIRGKDGQLLATSDAFETGRLREIHHDVAIPSARDTGEALEREPEPALPWDGEGRSEGVSSE